MRVRLGFESGELNVRPWGAESDRGFEWRKWALGGEGWKCGEEFKARFRRMTLWPLGLSRTLWVGGKFRILYSGVSCGFPWVLGLGLGFSGGVVGWLGGLM